LVPERYGVGELRDRNGGSARIEIDLKPGETRELDIEVETLDERIEGRVVDGTGKPFAGVSVAVARQIDDEDQYGNAMFLARNEETCGVITDGDGRFTIDRLGKGRYTVVAYRAEGEELTIRDVDVGQRVTMMLDPTGAIAGRIVDRNGRAVRDVELHARATLWFERTEELRTESGGFVLDGLSPGRWLLEVLSEEGSATVDAIVRSNRTTDMGEIEVAPSGIVRGRVVDSSGDAVAGIGIVAGGVGRRSVHVETDSEGSYELRFPAGDVFISVSPGLRGHARGQVPADGIVELPAIQIESR
jgi:hypothetical protein